MDESDKKKIKKIIKYKSVKDIVGIFSREKIFQNQKFIIIVFKLKMKIKLFLGFFTILFLTSCVGTSSTGIFGTGVTIAMDPRTLGTQIDDSIMDKSLDAKLISTNKSYILNVKTKIIDGRIFITGKVETVEEKLNITKMAWEIKGARSVKNDLKIKDKFNFKQSAKDLLITSQLRSALIFNKNTKAVNYNIDTIK